MGIMRVIGGIVMIGIGCIFIFKTEWFMQNIGTIEWFEQKMATYGGSRSGYKFVGLILIFIGLVMATGMYNGFMQATVGRLVPAPQ